MEEYYGHPWVIFTLDKEKYAVATPFVRSMVAMPETNQLPEAPRHIRGLIKVREHVVPLIDLRVRLGMDSFLDRINSQIAMLKEREQEHRNWLVELENSVKEQRPFTLATDHRKCKFGQWYETYEPKTYVEKEFLKKFALPHKRIHEVAIKVKERTDANDMDGALALISRAHDRELAQMLMLFSLFIKITREQAGREITIVLEDNGVSSAITVDSVVSVERLAPDSVGPMPDFGSHADKALCSAIAKSSKDGSLLILLDAKAVIDEARSVVT